VKLFPNVVSKGCGSTVVVALANAVEVVFVVGDFSSVVSEAARSISRRAPRSAKVCLLSAEGSAVAETTLSSEIKTTNNAKMLNLDLLC
jgi:hypothetical protein